MRTVKEVSDLTGISVRTLHYYDEIGLLKPTEVSRKGYRLYDDRALENLQQILFFREFDMPLGEIKKIMENPAFDRNHILQSQRKMLALKRERLDRLIHSIDDILGGNNSMNFEVFSKDDIESIFQAQMSRLSETQRKAMVEKYGGEDGFHKYFVQQMESEQTQKNLQKVLEWYGDKERMLESATNPIGAEAVQAYQRRLDAVMKKFADRKELPITSFEVKEAVAEYGFVMRQMFRLREERQLMCETAELYRTNVQMQEAFDGQYGEGMAERFASAVLEFYRKGRTFMDQYPIVKISEQREMMGKAVLWFHEKWGIPKEAYAESMEACIRQETPVPEWYVVLDGEEIIAGAGVIENDFHNRRDLAPNVCAVYVEEKYRNRGIAGKLLGFICEDFRAKKVGTLYLLTDHTSFYERYGWEFLCMVQGDGEAELSRMYIHKM